MARKFKSTEMLKGKVKVDGDEAVIRLPKSILNYIGKADGDTLFCIGIDGVLQITPKPTTMAIPVQDSDVAHFETQ